MKKYIFGFTLIFFLAGCSSTNVSHQESDSNQNYNEPVYSVYLIGDAGAATLEPREPVLEVLHTQLMQSGERSSVIFLGDNVYPDGLPPKGGEKRNQSETRILSQLETVEDYPGRVVFIPGNHDWNTSGRDGLEWLNRQEEYIESYLDRGNVFLPDNGLPGPVSVELVTHADFNIQLVLLDTQWWLHPYDKPLDAGVENEEDQKHEILQDLKEIVEKNIEDEIVVASHHPLFSLGRHGGKFPTSTHFLPPVFGSIYVAYRNIRGYPQDIARYDNLKEGLMKSLEEKEGLIYASGHEHSLQFIPYQNGQNRQYQLVSGSASKPSFVKKSSGENSTYRGEGFIAIRYFRDQTKRIEFWNESGSIVHQRIIEADE
ncbi:MAG: metallophosphoesterase [Balneolaceae bacterium]|nr:metallophosphoesterase [Balneolaceae bacterium]